MSGGKDKPDNKLMINLMTTQMITQTTTNKTLNKPHKNHQINPMK
jgi:hypothetical protein